MDTQLSYLAWSALLCIVLWVPYVIERVLNQGLTAAVGYPEDPKPPAAWAQRAHRAHLNMVENLPAFAALVLIAFVTGEDAAAGAAVFFYARLVHAAVFIAGIPWIRTLSFFVSWIGMLMIFFTVI